MRYLLDTNALIWWFEGGGRLRDEAIAVIKSPRNDVMVSMVSLWEILIKVRIGKLKVDLDTLFDLGNQGFSALAVEERHLRVLATLPVHHRDPFDHLLMAQAIAEDAIFLSSDEIVASYPVRHLRCA